MNSLVTSFRVRELFPLGRGGMGTTYLGCAKSAGGFERLIAIKRLHEHLQEDSEACARLLAEAELAGCVHHANVVAVQHVDRDRRGAFLVLDYVEGGSLRELMRAESGPIPQAIALRLFLDCLSGLEAIHNATDHRGQSLHILHRDISPENILVGLDGMARLTDFGIARSRFLPSLTGPSQLVGKLAFMAPEYIDRGRLGPPLDIYSLGVTLWMLLVGRGPWGNLEEAQLLAALLTEGVPALPDKPNLGPELRAVVAKACALDADDRFQSAREFSLALQQASKSHPIAERVEVVEYVQGKFLVTTSERRIEAAQLLQVPSERPPPSPMQLPWEDIDILPVVSSRILPSLLPPEGPFDLANRPESPAVSDWPVKGESAHDEVSSRSLLSSREPLLLDPVTQNYDYRADDLVVASRRTTPPLAFTTLDPSKPMGGRRNANKALHLGASTFLILGTLVLVWQMSTRAETDVSGATQSTRAADDDSVQPRASSVEEPAGVPSTDGTPDPSESPHVSFFSTPAGLSADALGTDPGAAATPSKSVQVPVEARGELRRATREGQPPATRAAPSQASPSDGGSEIISKNPYRK